MEYKTKRSIMSVFGVLAAGVSVGFLKRAALGVDPFQAFMSGLDALAPISFGTLYLLVSLCLLTFSLVCCRSYIGLGTLVTMVFQGYVIDLSTNFLFQLFPTVSFPGRFFFFLLGILLLCLASSIYFTADLGVSAYDAIALILERTFHIGRFKYNRIACDLVCVTAGSFFFLGAGNAPSDLTAVVGLGTIITAFFMGPLIDFFAVHIAKPMLYGFRGMQKRCGS